MNLRDRAEQIETRAEYTDEPSDWLVTMDAWEEAGEPNLAWYARLRSMGRGRGTPSRAVVLKLHDRIRRFEAAREQFDPRRFRRGGGYLPEDYEAIARLAGVAVPSNDDRGYLELYDFMTTQPPRLFGYYDPNNTLRTFTGHLLGVIERRGTRRRVGFRGRATTLVQNVTVRGENGFYYNGTCNLETGTYCSLRRGKSWLRS